MKKVIILLALFVLAPALASTNAYAQEKQVNWGAVTQYTDGTPIESSKAILYNAWMDNVPLAVKTPNTWVKFTVPDHNVAHIFTAQVELSTGEKSVISTPTSWTSPAATPAGTGACSISDPTH